MASILRGMMSTEVNHTVLENLLALKLIARQNKLSTDLDI